MRPGKIPHCYAVSIHFVGPVRTKYTQGISVGGAHVRPIVANQNFRSSLCCDSVLNDEDMLDVQGTVGKYSVWIHEGVA